jgi:hypothetical protein
LSLLTHYGRDLGEQRVDRERAQWVRRSSTTRERGSSIFAGYGRV